MHHVRRRTATKMFEALTSDVAYAPSHELSVAAGGAAQLHSVVAEAESMEWDVDLKSLWLTHARWSLLIRQYLDRPTVNDWLSQIERKMDSRSRGVAVMRTNAVAKRKDKSASWREWGACILTFSYRALPAPQLTMHSRTAYVGGLGALDLSLAWHLAKLIGERKSLSPSDMSLVWFVESAQFHGLKSLPWVLADTDRAGDILNMNRSKAREPGFRAAKSWVQSFLHDDEERLRYGDMTYGQTRRARKRFHTEVMGYDYGAQFEGGDHPQASQNRRFKPLPSLRVQDLDLSPLDKGKPKPSEIIRALYVKENDR